MSDVLTDAGVSTDGSVLDADTVDAAAFDASTPDATMVASDAGEAGTPVLDAATSDGAMPADLQALVTTVQKNLPTIILMVQGQGTLASEAATDVVATGTAVVKNTSALNGKAVACAGVAAQASVTAEASLSVTVNASSSVSMSRGRPMEGLLTPSASH